MKITEIALRLDYKDVGYFSQLFKKQYGIVPSQYRLPDNYTLSDLNLYKVTDLVAATLLKKKKKGRINETEKHIDFNTLYSTLSADSNGGK